MEPSASHKVPVTWIREHGCAPIRWRTLTEILPPASATEEDYRALREEALAYRGVTQTVKKQRPTGVWAGNILGTAPDKARGIRDVGTVAQYRHLLELGVPPDQRCVRLTNRVFFRLLSNDPDPKLFFEFEKDARSNPAVGAWGRELMREATAAALAQVGLNRDPRVRGAAQRILNAVSKFLRSNLAEDPFVKVGARTTLHAEARPPTTFSLAMAAFMPGMQRERAGLVERLGQYLARPAPKKTYSILVGKKVIKPTVQILGDPLTMDAQGRPTDIPFALHWLELLARLGMLETSHQAQRALGRLLSDCNDNGVWSPRSLSTFPKSRSGLADFAFPLEMNAKSADSRKADVTFRLALITKLLGWNHEYT